MKYDRILISLFLLPTENSKITLGAKRLIEMIVKSQKERLTGSDVFDKERFSEKGPG